jgi:UDP-N-acetylmuramoyl-tripeptide--D-alanyl-D-alanine ligase
MRRTLAELATVTGAQVRGAGETLVSRVALDSREAGPGDLFVALPGARVDGHDFVPQVAERGAAAALVSRALPVDLPQLVVADTLAALQQIAVAERVAGSYRLVAVTGSIAKTTTKEMLAALLSTSCAVGWTRGNRNSEIGFPAEVCNQPDGISWLVAELGMSHAGELDRLGAIARPDALLYTVVAPVHLEFFASLDAIAEAKAELIPHLDPEGVMILNGADERVARLGARFAGRTVRYGVPEASDWWLADYESLGLVGSRFTLRGRGVGAAVVLPLPGRHQADNLLAAAAAAITLGAGLEAVAAKAATLSPGEHRGVVHRLPDGVTLVDDSYNASPVATSRVLELLAATPGRRVAVLGEMLELGGDAPRLHREVGEQAARSAHLVLAVGGANAAELALPSGGRGRHVPDWAAALEVLRGELEPGDVALVKGSRGVALDRVVSALLGETGR